MRLAVIYPLDGAAVAFEAFKGAYPTTRSRCGRAYGSYGSVRNRTSPGRRMSSRAGPVSTTRSRNFGSGSDWCGAITHKL